MTTTAKTPKGRIVTVGNTTDHGIHEATGIGRYTETKLMVGTVQVSSFGYYSRCGLETALIRADEFIDATCVEVTQ